MDQVFGSLTISFSLSLSLLSLSLSLSPLCWPTCLHDPFVANRGAHHTSDQTTGSLQVKEIVGVGAVFPRHASLNAGGGARGVACSVRQTDANDSHSTQHFFTEPDSAFCVCTKFTRHMTKTCGR